MVSKTMNFNSNGPKKPTKVKVKAIDLEFLRSVTADDIEFEKELFILFIDSAKKNIKKMEVAIKDSDDNSWYMASHALKGASASIGAFDMAKALEYAQTHPKEDQDKKNKILTDIKKEFQEVSEFINDELNKQ